MNIVSLVGRQPCSKKREQKSQKNKKRITTLASGLGVETKLKIKNEHCQPGKHTTCSKKKRTEKSEKQKKECTTLASGLGVETNKNEK